MARMILDCELMKTRDSGLYHYCLNLGRSINELLREEGRGGMKMYVPPAEKDAFTDKNNTIVEKHYHKFFRPFLADCKIWHRPFQSGRIIPPEGSKTKIVLTVHDLNMLHQNMPAKELEENIRSTREIIKRADAIVCISEFTKSDVIKHCDVGSRPVHVIHNGINRLDTPALTTKSYRPSHPFLFSIGFMNRKKNQHALLPLLENNPNLELLLAGRPDDPDYVDAMKAEAKKKGMSDRLHILGPVTEGEKAWYLHNCLAYMHPSLAEGFGLPVVEAMSLGKPVFLSNLTSLPEIGGDAAFYFENFEAEHMQEVLDEGMKRYHEETMHSIISEQGRKFSWLQSAKKYLDVYRSIM